MLLTLQRSPQQEADLKSLLAAQQDPTSASYHKWLTPETFGKRFGVADADIQTVTGYLASQGLSIGRVYGSHAAIEVSATAEQIQATFQTEIHAYSLGGKTYYANNTAPKIPAALRGVVGFASMNNFRVAGGSGAGTAARLDTATHTLKPLYTTTDSGGNTVYGVSPGDLATIYDIPAPNAQGLGGQGIKVGIVGDSNINVSYVNNYRSIFGLSANAPVVIIDGNDPGITGDAYIAYKQIELVGAVAPNATIYYYTSADTDYDTGLSFALVRALEDNQVQVLLNGFQSCETDLKQDMVFLNALAEQAAAQGITVVAASGNTGPAACEIPGNTAKATKGYAVNGYASSPFVTAVGGTDFNYGFFTPATNYWKNTNSSTYSSAIAYPPEQVWNDSNQNGSPNVLLASGGGISTAGDGISTPQPIPTYQSSNAQALAISRTSRMLPDIAFFAGTGANDTVGYAGSAYMFCMTSTDCQTGSGKVQFTYSGGTEASSAVFAGTMALVVQRVNGSGTQFGVGNVNPVLYTLLTNGSTVNHDIASTFFNPAGDNELQCTGTTNCSGGLMTGYQALNGYDAATGLGSFDISSLVSTFAASNVTPSKVSIAVIDPATGLPPVCVVAGVTTPNCTIHSTALKFVVSAVSASGTGATPTGDVAIYTDSPLAVDRAVESLTLANGTATENYFTTLRGGSFNIYARYAGDSTYSSSVSATPYHITVKSEPCHIILYGHNVNPGTTTTMPYGSPVMITVEPYSTANTNNVAIPSGSINVNDTYAGVNTVITTVPTNSEGAATFKSNLLSFGLHSLVLTFPGDANFGSCQSAAFGVSVAKASTTTTLNAPENDTGNGTASLGVTAVVQSAALPSNGTAPTGTVTFNTKVPKVGIPLFAGFDPNGNAIATASITVGQSDVPASGIVTAVYNPAGTEVNYNGSTSNPVSFYSSTTTLNHATRTTFTLTDNNATYITPPAGGFPARDSLTLNMKVVALQPNQTRFLVYANGVQLSPPIVKDGQGFVIGGGIPIPASGKATFTIPQQNGYLALPSGQVQLSVIYDGWVYTDGSDQSDPSSSNQTITINDDRTSADFALQSDLTVNANPTPAGAATVPLTAASPQAIYNLRLTSIYNFQSAYSTTPINLGCKVIGYISFTGVSSTPTGLACGFDSSLSGAATSVTFASNSVATGFITQNLYVGAASGFAVASNDRTPAPASRWWLATGGTTLACVLLFGLPARRRNWQSMLGACVLVILSFGMTGCGVTIASGPEQAYYNRLNGTGTNGGQGSGTSVPLGTYMVLVTASSTTNTTLVHTMPIQVLVGLH